MNIFTATEQNRNEALRLLQSQNLPAEDLPPLTSDFLVAVEAEKLIGLIGMERYGKYALLRSMVVDPEHRNKRIAERLVLNLEQTAQQSGIAEMYLLTETADKYFSKKGYERVMREEVPAELKMSSEFSHVCPASAVVMKKKLSTETQFMI